MARKCDIFSRILKQMCMSAPEGTSCLMLLCLYSPFVSGLMSGVMPDVRVLPDFPLLVPFIALCPFSISAIAY